MAGQKTIICTVTNDLVFDQRMIRICTSLAGAGYRVMLVGRQYKESPPLAQYPFEQHRLHCFFRKGFLFYAEYNLRLLLFLLGQKATLFCAIDLDTILPVLLASKWKRNIRVYDAHELFCEMKEIVTRPGVYRIWRKIEQLAVPQFRLGYTVTSPIRDYFMKTYGVHYEVVRNMPLLQPPGVLQKNEPYILYQGAVNEGRSFETLIPAFQWINIPLHIYGDGNFMEQAMALVQQYGLEHKILFKGKCVPEKLRGFTPSATLGLTLFENKGLSNYYSLANRFFDYLHAGVPQLCVDYPVYKEINEQFEVAVLIKDLSPQNIAATINALLADKEKMARMQQQCRMAAAVFSWQQEEKTLVQFYKNTLD